MPILALVLLKLLEIAINFDLQAECYLRSQLYYIYFQIKKERFKCATRNIK